jgi:hypothetical protein
MNLQIGIAFVIVYSTLAVAQSQPPALDALLHELQSGNWQVRAVAVAQLEADADMRRSPATKRALIQLLDRENRYLRDPRRTDSEVYGEYYSVLLGRVFSFVDSEDASALAIVVGSACNGDSPLAMQLGSYGQTVVAPLLERARDRRLSDWRSEGYDVLGFVLQQSRLGHSRHPLNAHAVRDVEQCLRAGLRDLDASVRMASIRGVVAAGDMPSLPILEQVRKSDPWFSPATQTYSIRERAEKAIAAIKEHPLTK